MSELDYGLTKNVDTHLSILSHAIAVSRKRNKLSQAEVARRIGVSRSTFCRIEAGDDGCEIGNVLRAADAVGLRLFESGRRKQKLKNRIIDQLQALPERVST